jgi:hypothetical protein
MVGDEISPQMTQMDADRRGNELALAKLQRLGH